MTTLTFLQPKRGQIVKPFQDPAQGAVDQTFAEIKHGLDCRLCSLRQNRLGFTTLPHHCRDGKNVIVAGFKPIWAYQLDSN